MHANLYNFEMHKLRQAEAERLATDERWATTVRRAQRRTRRALWSKLSLNRSRTHSAQSPSRALAN